MRFAVCILSSAVLTLSITNALAAPATSAQADKISTAIESYLGAKPGLITVRPAGDVYDVTVDFSVYKTDLATSGVSFDINPQHYKVRDAGGGKWRVDIDEKVSGSFKVAGSGEPRKPSIDAKISMQIKSTSTFEETMGIFSETVSDVKDLSLDETVAEPTGEASTIRYVVDAMHQEARASTQGDGVDATLNATMEGLEETFNVAAKDGGTPLSFKLNAARGSQTADIKGLKFEQLRELVRFAVRHANDVNKKPLEDELRKLAKQALPVLGRMVTDGAMEQVTIDTSIGQFVVDKAAVNLAMNGFVANGEFSEGVVIEGLSLPSGLLPSYATELLPQRVAFDIKLADFDLAEAAKVFIAEVDSAKAAQPELDAKLAKVILPHGTMTISTGATQIKGKAYDVSLTGDMKVGPVEKPSGQGVIKATGIDEIVKQLQAAPPEAGTAQAVAGILVAKGFGKVEGDNVTWTIVAQPDGAVLINGIDVSKLAGAPPQQQ